MFRIYTIVHNRVVHGQAAGIVYRPSDDCQIAAHQGDFWPLADQYPLWSWSDWTFLSKQPAAQDHDRQCQKSFVHVTHLNLSQDIKNEILRSTAVDKSRPSAS